VHLGQPDVEDHRVIGFGFAEIVAFFAVEGAIDHIAGVGQRGRELPVEVGIVLDDEEAHIYSPLCRTIPDSWSWSCRPMAEPLAASMLACATMPLRPRTVST